VLLSLVFVTSSLGLHGVRHLLGNPLARFLSAISFQFYMWHQLVASEMRRWGIPSHSSPQPHMTGERAWQIPFVILALIISLGLSAALTWFLERPIARRLSGKKR